MSVEGIIDRIMSDAKGEVDSILGEARQQVKAIQKENEREAQEYFDRQRELLDEKYRKEKERAILNRRLDERKSVLQTRQTWMDRAFEEARNRLVNQPMNEYGTLMKQLIETVSSAKDEEVQFGTKGEDKELKSIINELNKTTGSSFTLAKERGDFPWGFILRKGKVETNMSIESLFKYKRNDLEQRAWELFNADV
jgi:vacuolar-type H+-ATPase subunit E/Vma4